MLVACSGSLYLTQLREETNLALPNRRPQVSNALVMMLEAVFPRHGENARHAPWGRKRRPPTAGQPLGERTTTLCSLAVRAGCVWATHAVIEMVVKDEARASPAAALASPDALQGVSLEKLAHKHPCVTLLFCDIVGERRATRCRCPSGRDGGTHAWAHTARRPHTRVRAHGGRAAAGFTTMSMELEPERVMLYLNALYTAYDALTDEHGVFKIETVGGEGARGGGCCISSGAKAPRSTRAVCG